MLSLQDQINFKKVWRYSLTTQDSTITLIFLGYDKVMGPKIQISYF